MHLNAANAFKSCGKAVYHVQTLTKDRNWTHNGIYWIAHRHCDDYGCIDGLSVAWEGLSSEEDKTTVAGNNRIVAVTGKSLITPHKMLPYPTY